MKLSGGIAFSQILALTLIQFTYYASATDCDVLSYYSDQLEKCLEYVTEYSALCYEDKQCSEWLQGDEYMSCINNRCLCKENYRWFQGKCQKYVGKGESCTQDTECYDEMDPLALTCKTSDILSTNKTCQCSSDYYDRGYDCRFKSGLLGDCAVASDCQPISLGFVTLYSTCALGSCVSTSKNEGVEDYVDEYYKDIDVTPTLTQYLLNNILKDDNNGSSTNLCVQGVAKSNTSSECAQCNNTMWFKDSVCICKPGFFLQNGNCVAELGMADASSEYKTNKDCPIKPAKFENEACYCKNYWFNDYTNRNCIKTTLQVTKSCMNDMWCRPMGPYSFCNTTSSQCQCDKIATFNESSFYCELTQPATGDECLKDTNCPVYEECRDEKCACVDNFFRINGTCFPDIGGSCEFRNCSHISNSVCSSDKKCDCAEGYVSDSSKCVKVAKNLFDDCQVQTQCKNIPHSVCKEYTSNTITKIGCICDSDFVNVNGTCHAYKTYGSTCSTRLNCTVVMNDSVQCRNSICQCPVSKTYNDGYCSAALMTFDNHQVALFVVVLAWFFCKF